MVVSDWCITILAHGWWVPLNKQFLPLTMPTVLWIKTHQPVTIVIHQSLTTMVV